MTAASACAHGVALGTFCMLCEAIAAGVNEAKLNHKVSMKLTQEEWKNLFLGRASYVDLERARLQIEMLTTLERIESKLPLGTPSEMTEALVCCSKLQRELSGQEWSAETMARVAQILGDHGFKIAEVPGVRRI